MYVKHSDNKTRNYSILYMNYMEVLCRVHRDTGGGNVVPVYSCNIVVLVDCWVQKKVVLCKIICSEYWNSTSLKVKVHLQS